MADKRKYRVTVDYEVEADTIQEVFTHLRRAGPVDSYGVRVVGLGVEPKPEGGFVRVGLPVSAN